jgi:FkbM family methyltransferase
MNFDQFAHRLRRSPVGSALAWIARPFAHLRPGSTGARNRDYDRQAVAVLARVMRRDSSAIDVGAHRGSVLRHIVRRAPAGSHIAFEPIPALAARLRRVFPTVLVHEQAVGEVAGSSAFLHVVNAPAYSGLRRRQYDRDDPVITPVTVQVVRLDDVIPADRPIRFVKIDIEGGEFHAIAGAAGLIARDRPIIVFEAGARSTGEYGVTAEAFFDLLTRDLGYRVSTMSRWLRGGNPYDAGEWTKNWLEGPDFCFIAYPLGKNYSTRTVEERQA